MGARRDDLVEVLFDDTEPPGAGERGGATPRRRVGRPRRPRRPWSPRRRRGVVAAGLALAVGVLAVRWDAATLQALPVLGVPGLSVSLSAPLHELWQVDGRIAGVLPGGSTVLVTTADAAEARDVESGAVVWTTSEPTAWCDLAGLGQGVVQTSTQAAADQGPQIALCGLADGTTVQALDPLTGRVLVEVDVESYTWSPSLVDGDLVLAGVDTTGHVTAARWSTATGEQVWSTVGPEVATVAQGVSAQADGPVITVEWGGGSMDVDAETGAQLSVADAPADGLTTASRIELADGSVASQDVGLSADGLDDARVRVEGPDGSLVLNTPGYLLRPAVDDGSAAGTILVFDSATARTRVLDLATGREAWSSDLTPDLVVDGRIVGWSAPGELTALSAANGDVLWTRQVAQANNSWSTVCDGRRVLYLEGRDVRLVARSLATGRQLWSVDQSWITAASADAYGAMLSALPSGPVVLSSGDRTVVLGR